MQLLFSSALDTKICNLLPPPPSSDVIIVWMNVMFMSSLLIPLALVGMCACTDGSASVGGLGLVNRSKLWTCLYVFYQHVFVSCAFMCFCIHILNLHTYTICFVQSSENSRFRGTSRHTWPLQVLLFCVFKMENCQSSAAPPAAQRGAKQLLLRRTQT